MAAEVTECAEEAQHKARRLAVPEVENLLLRYQGEHGLSDIVMALVLTEITRMFLQYVGRDDEERRTGFRHRLAGE
jgi:hypothetical protein